MHDVKDKKRVTVIDDHELVRDGLHRILAQSPDFDFCCGKGTAEDGLDCVGRHKPDLCVVDISMPGLSGIDAVRRILDIHAACKVLVLSVHDEALYAARAFRAGAHGYIMKQECSDRILTAIQRVASGETYMSEAIQRSMLRGYLATDEAPGRNVSGLTDREFEILRLLGQGCSISGIAERLHRSPKTIDVYRQNLKRKLNLESANELVLFAARWVENQAAHS